MIGLHYLLLIILFHIEYICICGALTIQSVQLQAVMLKMDYLTCKLTSSKDFDLTPPGWTSDISLSSTKNWTNSELKARILWRKPCDGRAVFNMVLNRAITVTIRLN